MEGAISEVRLDSAEFMDRKLNLFMDLDIARVNVAFPVQNIPEETP